MARWLSKNFGGGIQWYTRATLQIVEAPPHFMKLALAYHKFSGNSSVDAMKVGEFAIIAVPTISSIWTHMTLETPVNTGRALGTALAATEIHKSFELAIGQ